MPPGGGYYIRAIDPTPEPPLIASVLRPTGSSYLPWMRNNLTQGSTAPLGGSRTNDRKLIDQSAGNLHCRQTKLVRLNLKVQEVMRFSHNCG